MSAQPSTPAVPNSTTPNPPVPACWPPGVPTTLEVPDESLWQAFAARVHQQPDEVGLHCLGRDWTWAELGDQTSRLTGALQQRGMAAGDRVLVFMQNCPQYVIAFHAVLQGGGVVVPVNPMNKADELPHYIADAGAHIALASTDIAGELVAAQATLATDTGLKHLIAFDLADMLPPAALPTLPAAWQSWLGQRHPLPVTDRMTVCHWADALASAPAPTAVTVQGDDLALLPYTSGTTGAAKGCLHTHRNLLHNAMAAAPWLDMRPGDRTLIVVPMFHITGLVMGMLASVRHGCRLVILPRWDRLVAARTLETQRITHWPNIPTMVIDLLADASLRGGDWSSLRYIGGGGAPMPDPVAADLKARFGLDYVEGYGLTETAAPTHLNPMHAPKRQCLGVPFISTQARVIDPVTLAPLPTGEVGEIVVHGPQVFKGYWHQERATRDAFIELDGHRFFRTGDLGRVDEDGYYHMVDRLKRMINASGFKVWPAEVEALLHKHPAVKESCVIALRDPYRGETVKAVIVLRDEAVGTVTEDDIIQWAKAHMAAYKYPRVVEFARQLPRTASGKVLWRRVQDTEDAARP